MLTANQILYLSDDKKFQAQLFVIRNTINEIGYIKTLYQLVNANNMPMIFLAYVIALYNENYRNNEPMTFQKVIKTFRV